MVILKDRIVEIDVIKKQCTLTDRRYVSAVHNLNMLIVEIHIYSHILQHKTFDERFRPRENTVFLVIDNFCRITLNILGNLFQINRRKTHILSFQTNSYFRHIIKETADLCGCVHGYINSRILEHFICGNLIQLIAVFLFVFLNLVEYDASKRNIRFYGNFINFLDILLHVNSKFIPLISLQNKLLLYKTNCGYNERITFGLGYAKPSVQIRLGSLQGSFDPYIGKRNWVLRVCFAHNT